MSEDLRKKIQTSRLPPMMPPGGGGSLPGGRNGPMMRGKKDYTPISWDQYFDRKTNVKIDDDSFSVYECGTEGPVCLMLHGGGFSALSWALVSKSLCHLVACRCAAIDCRGHGDTYTSNDTDLSADTLASDVGRVVNQMYGEDPPPIVLIGHSMGGAIAVHSVVQNKVPSVVGLIVIDVVEGTALEGLASMQSFLHGRPSEFKSLEHAIEYCVRTGAVRNLNSARVSVIGQVKRRDGGATVVHTSIKTPLTANISQSPVLSTSGAGSVAGIREEEEEDEVDRGAVLAAKESQSRVSNDLSDRLPPAPHSHKSENNDFKRPTSTTISSTPIDAAATDGPYVWRIDLTKTDIFWKGWFEGMSKMFLSCSAPKMLLLAGVDRLDKELTVGQMQGKFQMQVLTQCGHAAHEDNPEKVADAFATFLVRNRLAAATDNFQSRIHSRQMGAK